MIQIKNLVKKYGEVSAVNDISLEVQAGEIFAFLGPNGAGKTTTIKMLTTLLTPTSGSIRIDGLDPITHSTDVRRRFGIVFQDPSLDQELTAYENMDLHGVLYGVPRTARHQRTEHLLTLFELWDRRDDLVKNYSGGMKRRLEIARGFLHTPKILFLDEPTLGLDPQTRNQLWTRVKTVNEQQGVTVFLTTHYMEEADQACDRAAIFDHGKVVVQGTSASLKALLPAVETIEASFVAAPPAWSSVVAALPGVEAVAVHDGTCLIHSRDRGRTLAALVQAAGEKSVTISSLSLRGTTLEDVFIHFTGRDLRDAAGAWRVDKRLLHES
jgi:ABC-2 type transport system ATP-binding protein